MWLISMIICVEIKFEYISEITQVIQQFYTNNFLKWTNIFVYVLNFLNDYE